MQLEKTDVNESKQQFIVDNGIPIGTWIKKLSLVDTDEHPHEQQSQYACSTDFVLQRSKSDPKLSSFALRALNKSVSDGLTNIENRKRLQATRQLFMDLERRKVKESMKYVKQQKTINRLIELKEQERVHQEQLFAQETKEKNVIVDVNCSDSLTLEKISKQRSHDYKLKELERYILALKTSLKNRCQKLAISVPCMCGCFESIWEADPFRCSNNCAFYKNPAAFATSLHSLLNSCQVK